MMKNTSGVLSALRGLMKTSAHVSPPLQAYIVPSGDAHMSEYIADCDMRRAYISGFTGSAGTAIVTHTDARLWTDGRYFLQAEAQLDSNWTLMKDGVVDTLSQADWLCKVLPSGSRVGVDPYLLSSSAWRPLSEQLELSGLSLVGVTPNLVDLTWEDRPPPPRNTVTVHPDVYTGRAWCDKVAAVRASMAARGAGALVVSALDQVAWLLNLRGADISYNPVFFSYVLVTQHSTTLFVEPSQVSGDLRQRLTSPDRGQPSVDLLPYDAITDSIASLLEHSPSDKVWVCERSTSEALSRLVPKTRRVSALCPVAEMKAVKNCVELAGMRACHVRDAVAVCEYLAWLEREVPKGNVSEISGSDKLEEYRRQQKDFVSLSFATISATGADGAIIHYRAQPGGDKMLSTDELYLCDSGAQYRDGTTDITRTIHLGTPTRHQQECFTRVLQGHIGLAKAVFPNGVKGSRLDALARCALWAAGLDYQHGTGHGVGAYLNVHEGPCGISYRTSPTEVALKEGMVLSDEPGYYEDGAFGIRIESLVIVKKADTKLNFKDKGFLTFEPITMVPIQSKMILAEMLSEEEVSWVNDFHQKCRETTGEALKAQGRMTTFEWLLRETQTISTERSS